VSLNKLRGEIDLWEAECVLRAPADGVVAFYDFWSDQQYVTAGRQVFLIVPETSRLIGCMSVNQGGAGKIKPGQVVRIRFADFPYREFGLVTGRVQSVSMVARDGANLVLVDIPYPAERPGLEIFAGTPDGFSNVPDGPSTFFGIRGAARTGFEPVYQP
jgi:hypothetical protein